MYQLFAGHSHRTVEDLTWQEVASKCRVKLLRVPLSYGGDVGEELSQDEQQQQDSNYMRGREKADEYAYELRVVEDLDDGRVHEEEGEEVDDIKNAGRRLSIPIHQVRFDTQHIQVLRTNLLVDSQDLLHKLWEVIGYRRRLSRSVDQAR